MAHSKNDMGVSNFNNNSPLLYLSSPRLSNLKDLKHVKVLFLLQESQMENLFTRPTTIQFHFARFPEIREIGKCI